MKSMKILARGTLSEDRNSLIIRLDSLPHDVKSCFVKMETELMLNHAAWQMVTITSPTKPRSTGYRSQNSRIHGHCADIAAQAGKAEFKDPEQIKLLMKYLAIDRGYPHSEYRGKIIPKKSSECNTLEANILLETIQQFADENNFYLTEYTKKQGNKDAIPYKSIGGRTLAEMQKFYPELNKDIK